MAFFLMKPLLFLVIFCLLTLEAESRYRDSDHSDRPYLTPSKPFFPKSCLDYRNRGIRKTAIYKLYDTNGQSFPAFCDMTSEPGNAWTLIMSWSTQNRLIPQFSATQLSENSPVHENAPNWNLYRVTLDRMQTIKTHSTHWRSTCSFPTHGVDYRDYVKGNFKDFDVLSFVGAGVCQKVEFVDIRGHIGIHTTIPWWQKSGHWGLHTDSSLHASCAFKDAVSGAVGSEDDFGYYHTINPKFRCTANSTATTQWWFGGHI